MLEILNANSGAITAITTIILTIITGVYVYLTRLMLKSTNMPVVRMFLHASEYSITLCVQNIGIGFARDIKFSGDLSFKPTQPGNVKLKDLKPFKGGIPYLGPGHKSETFLCGRHELGNLPGHKFDITVSYKDLANLKDEETSTFEVGNWNNTNQLGSPHTDDTTKAIESVAAELKQMNTQNRGRGNTKMIMGFTLPSIVDTLKRIADALEGKQSPDE